MDFFQNDLYLNGVIFIFVVADEEILHSVKVWGLLNTLEDVLVYDAVYGQEQTVLGFFEGT